jgi:(p)ppGpp synthase/HD superfamily hydrolase
LRKLLVATSQDARVLIIKMMDRLHNMRTLQHVPEEKRKRIALETIEIYAAIAHRLFSVIAAHQRWAESLPHPTRLADARDQ